MKFVKNEGATDRAIRFAVSVLLFVLAFFSLSGAWQIVALVFAVLMLITAATGSCGMYKLLGIDTNKDDKK